MESNTRISAPNSLLRPLTRLTTVADHRIFIGDCVESQLDGFTDSPLRDCSLWSSKPFVFLDLIWNLAFVVVSVFVLLTTIREKPSTPLRVWIGGYAFQCLLHVGFVYLDYRRWNRADLGIENDSFLLPLCHSSITKKLQSVNTVISSIWWVFGFYWIVVGGQALMQDSPHLYWLAVIFLAFEVFFVIFCIGMACIVFFTLFCCFPIVATIAYAMAIQEGASESDLRTLPKFLYSQTNPFGTLDSAVKQDGSGLAMEPGNSYSTSKLALHPEDSECCICLHQYVEGVELCALPCNHHFHHECISKWLRINATCPLCKHSIFRGEMLV